MRTKRKWQECGEREVEAGASTLSTEPSQGILMGRNTDYAAVRRQERARATNQHLQQVLSELLRKVMLPPNFSPTQASQREALNITISFPHGSTRVFIQQIFTELPLNAKPCSGSQRYRDEHKHLRFFLLAAHTL